MATKRPPNPFKVTDSDEDDSISNSPTRGTRQKPTEDVRELLIDDLEGKGNLPNITKRPSRYRMFLLLGALAALLLLVVVMAFRYGPNNAPFGLPDISQSRKNGTLIPPRPPKRNLERLFPHSKSQEYRWARGDSIQI